MPTTLVDTNKDKTSSKSITQRWNRLGHCRTCGRTTHRNLGGFWTKSWEPLTIRQETTSFQGGPSTSTYIVYKGYCLEPTCYTITQAKELLKEEQQRHGKPTPTKAPTTLTRRHSSQPQSTVLSSQRKQQSSTQGRPEHNPANTLSSDRPALLRQARSQGVESRQMNWTLTGPTTSSATHKKPPVASLFHGSTNGVQITESPNEICRVLSEYGDDAHVCQLGLNYLRTALASQEGTVESTLNGDWVPLILAKLQQNKHRLDIVSKASTVLLWLAQQSHQQRMMQEGCVETMANILADYPNQPTIQEPVCELLVLLVQTECKLEDQLIVSLVRSLATVIQCCTKPTRTAALLLLFHLTQTANGSNQFKAATVSFKGLLSMAMDSTLR